MSVVARDAGPGHLMLFDAPRRSVPVSRGTEAPFSTKPPLAQGRPYFTQVECTMLVTESLLCIEKTSQ